MKKIYQAPSTDLIRVATQQMIAVSSPEKGFDPTSDDVPTTDATSGNLGRRNDIWADEEDEEIY